MLGSGLWKECKNSEFGNEFLVRVSMPVSRAMSNQLT